MKTLPTTIAYGIETSSDVPISIEQEEWGLYLGKVSKQQLITYLKQSLVTTANLEIVCGMDGTGVGSTVYVYKNWPEVEYDLYTSYGSLSEKVTETAEVIDELVQFRMSASESTNYPPDSVSKVEWTLDCLDGNGEEIANPTLQVNGSDISTGGVKVFGTAKVSYYYTRDVYTLIAPRRAEAVDNNYSAVIVGAVLGYKPVVHEMELPESVDYYEANEDYECGSTNATVVLNDDDSNIPEPTAKDLKTIVDYCSQIVIDEYWE